MTNEDLAKEVACNAIDVAINKLEMARHLVESEAWLPAKGQVGFARTMLSGVIMEIEEVVGRCLGRKEHGVQDGSEERPMTDTERSDWIVERLNDLGH